MSTLTRKRLRHRRRQFKRLEARGGDEFYIAVALRCQCYSPVCESVWAGRPCKREVLTCWCGVVNPYFAPIHGSCGGMGEVECLCGGDLCVCHNHGSAECFGCPDCDQDPDQDYDPSDDDY